MANEAKKKGVSADDLVKSEVDSKVANPTDEDVTAYYQAHQSRRSINRLTTLKTSSAKD